MKTKGLSLILLLALILCVFFTINAQDFPDTGMEEEAVSEDMPKHQTMSNCLVKSVMVNAEGVVTIGVCANNGRAPQQNFIAFGAQSQCMLNLANSALINGNRVTLTVSRHTHQNDHYHRPRKIVRMSIASPN